MANAGFNAATDIFGMGANWKVKDCNLNASASVAECFDSNADVTCRDVYGARIAPTATYELVSATTSLMAIGTVVTISGSKVAVESISVKTSKGSPLTATVTGKQVESGATTRRTYACGTLSLSPRHIAQDPAKLLGNSAPNTLIESTTTFSADVTLTEPKGTIEASDVSNGRVVGSFKHVSGTGVAISPPAQTGSTVVSQPASVTSPENDYVTTEYAITKSLTGTQPAQST